MASYAQELIDENPREPPGPVVVTCMADIEKSTQAATLYNETPPSPSELRSLRILDAVDELFES